MLCFGELVKSWRSGKRKNQSFLFLALGYEFGLYDFFNLDYAGCSNLEQVFKKNNWYYMRVDEVNRAVQVHMKKLSPAVQMAGKKYIKGLATIGRFVKGFLRSYPERDVHEELQMAIKRNGKRVRRQELLGAVVTEYKTSRMLQKVGARWIFNRDGSNTHRVIVLCRCIGTARKISLEQERWFAEDLFKGDGSVRHSNIVNLTTYVYARQLFERYTSWRCGFIPWKGVRCHVDLCVGKREYEVWCVAKVLKACGVIG